MSTSRVPRSSAGRHRPSRVALFAGVCVLLLTIASQVGLGGRNFFDVAMAGALAMALAVIAILSSDGRARRVAVLGLVLAAAPVVLLAISLASSQG